MTRNALHQQGQQTYVSEICFFCLSLSLTPSLPLSLRVPCASFHCNRHNFLKKWSPFSHIILCKSFCFVLEHVFVFPRFPSIVSRLLQSLLIPAYHSPISFQFIFLNRYFLVILCCLFITLYSVRWSPFIHFAYCSQLFAYKSWSFCELRKFRKLLNILFDHGFANFCVLELLSSSARILTAFSSNCWHLIFYLRLLSIRKLTWRFRIVSVNFLSTSVSFFICQVTWFGF